MNRAIVGLTVRQLLGQRRTLILAPFAALPVVIAILYRVGDKDVNQPRFTAEGLFGLLIIPMVLPLVALIFGTAAIGAEIEDGTAVYLLSKPLPRWRVLLSKLVVAAGASALLVGLSSLLTAAIAMQGVDDEGVIAGFTVATILGAVVYTCIFLSLSVVTSRAFIGGLIYSAIWEGLVTGLFTGTRVFSVREYTLGVADSLSSLPASIFEADMNGLEAVLLMATVSLAAVFVGIRALQSFEVGETS
jgi:ABC-2 type transport system permease protein